MIIKNIISAAIFTALAIAGGSCNNLSETKENQQEEQVTQSHVKDVVIAIDEYAKRVNEAGSIEEIQNLDNDFSNALSKYADSKEPVSESDRKAIVAASERLSISINARIEQISGKRLMEFDDLMQQKELFKTEIDKCTTLGQVINIGL